MLVATVVLESGTWIPLIVFANPLIVVVPVPLAAPNPMIFPVMVAEPEFEAKIPLYRKVVVVKVRGAV